MKKNAFLLLIPLLLSSCAQHIIVDYPIKAESSGTLTLQPSGKTSKTYLTIDDNLVVQKKKVKSITVNNVPEGERKVHYISNSSIYKEKVNGGFTVQIYKGKNAVKLIELPPYSGGYWAANIIGAALWGVGIALVTPVVIDSFKE